MSIISVRRGRHEYQTRLNAFLSQIKHIEALAPKEDYLYEIMDTVPFRDLETALMMATMETQAMPRAAND